MFCFHKWEEVERITAPPFSGASIEMARSTKKLLQQMMFGLTTIVYRCTKCGLPHTVEVLGVDPAKVLPFQGASASSNDR